MTRSALGLAARYLPCASFSASDSHCAHAPHSNALGRAVEAPGPDGANPRYGNVAKTAA